MPDRKSILLDGIEKTERIIEIGPSFNPLAPKREGWNAYSVDHADRDSLIEKYRHDPSVDTSKIEPVDFVWMSGALSDAVPMDDHGTFDVFLASHVIEHAPNLVDFLLAAEVFTRSTGRAVLAIPDKRVCFDFYRQVSTTGEILAANREGRSRHSRKTLWDYSAYQVSKHGGPGWGRADQAPGTFTYGLNEVVALTDMGDAGHYVDAHAWVFVPSSFALIMFELALLGQTDWQVARSVPAEYTEFYVWLQRGGRAKAAALSEQDVIAERLRLLDAQMLELEEQYRQLTFSHGSLLEADLARSHGLNAADQGQVAALRAEQEKTRLELERSRSLIAAIRATRAWRARSFCRKVLGLRPTSADE